MSDKDTLVAAIREPSLDACLKLLAQYDVKGRRRFASVARKVYKELDEARWSTSGDRPTPEESRRQADQLDTARACVMATATLGELKKDGWRVVPWDGSLLDVVKVLQPDWVDDWVRFILEDEPRLFATIRELYEAGLCAKPDGDGYVLGIMLGLPGYLRRDASLWEYESALHERIRTRPDICETDIWRLFEVEGNGEMSLAAVDKYLGSKVGTWADALITLSEDGTLSRGRLLDESLNALGRDFAQFRAGWYSRFHEAMKPTLEERNERRERYLALLGSSIPPTVSMALKALTKIDKHEALPAAALLDALTPVVQARAKATVTGALRLAVTAAKREPDHRGTASRLAISALVHEAADVQAKALDVFETLGGADDVEAVAALSEYADAVAPSLRARVQELAGQMAAHADTDTAPASTGRAATPVAPVETHEALLQELLHLLEDCSDPLRIERAFDGMSRLGATRPPGTEAVLGPLIKRAKTLLDNGIEDPLRHQMARAAYLYATVEREDAAMLREQEAAIHKAPPARSFEIVFALRSLEVLGRMCEGHALPLLGAPSDDRGVVAPADLLARYQQYQTAKVAPGAVDMTLALLRLAPEQRAETLETFAPDDEYMQAIAFALGAWQDIGDTGWLWVAAAAARPPFADHPEVAKRHGRRCPDAGVPARYDLELNRQSHPYISYTTAQVLVSPASPGKVPITYLASLLHVPFGGAYGNSGLATNLARWIATIWPSNPEPFFAAGVGAFNYETPIANSPLTSFMTTLRDGYTPVGANGSLILAIGLSSGDAPTRGLALDAAVAMIEEARWNEALIANALAQLVASHYRPVRRWTNALSEISAVSRKHTATVRDVIAGSLRHDPSDPPRDMGGLVELLYELSVSLNEPLDDPEALDYLRGVTGGGKLKTFAGKLIKQLESAA